VRILTVNLRAGGNSVTIPQIVGRASRHQVDAIVFSEYRDNAAGALLRTEAERVGLGYQASTPAKRGNGVLVVAGEPFVAVENPFGLGDDEYPNAVLKARLDRLHLYGVYLPGQDRKRPHLRCLMAAAKHHNEAGDCAICIGDMNSGRNETDIEVNVRSGKILDAFSTADLYRELEMYWTEAWAYTHPDEHEFSWYPFRRDPDYRSRAGWRIDKALLSPKLLPKLKAAEYDHAFRLDRLSDHSGLLIELGRS
jgi:exodeoxyribonuclease III